MNSKDSAKVLVLKNKDRFAGLTVELVQVPQFVRVPHHVDCGHLPVFYVERGRLKFAIGFERNAGRQSIDETNTNKRRLMCAEWNCRLFMHRHHAAGHLPPPSA
jgi:hypothetical protein